MYLRYHDQDVSILYNKSLSIVFKKKVFLLYTLYQQYFHSKIEERPLYNDYPRLKPTQLPTIPFNNQVRLYEHL